MLQPYSTLIVPQPQDVKISAGHEFIVTSDTQYAELCDDKHLFVDYVRRFGQHVWRQAPIFTNDVLTRHILGQHYQSHISRKIYLCGRRSVLTSHNRGYSSW